MLHMLDKPFKYNTFISKKNKLKRENERLFLLTFLYFSDMQTGMNRYFERFTTKKKDILRDYNDSQISLFSLIVRWGTLKHFTMLPRTDIMVSKPSYLFKHLIELVFFFYVPKKRTSLFLIFEANIFCTFFDINVKYFLYFSLCLINLIVKII